MTTVSLQHLHIRQHTTINAETCGRCHKSPSKLFGIRGFNGRFCETCVDVITDDIRHEDREAEYDRRFNGD